MLLSGYREGKPYYLYSDGTAPARSKFAARPIVLDSGVARRAGAPHASLHASSLSAQRDEQGGTRGQVSKVELSSARPRHRPLRWRRQGRLVVYRQACLARRTPYGTESRGKQRRLRCGAWRRRGAVCGRMWWRPSPRRRSGIGRVAKQGHQVETRRPACWQARHGAAPARRTARNTDGAGRSSRRTLDGRQGEGA